MSFAIVANATSVVIAGRRVLPETCVEHKPGHWMDNWPMNNIVTCITALALGSITATVRDMHAVGSIRDLI
jgi:hypothetical protein